MASSLWPVEPFEQKKVIPMIVMMFLICFNYTLLRDLKDILVLESMHTSAISFLKSAFVLPGSVIVMLVFTKMSHTLNRSQIFYSFMTLFVSFFALYGFVLYPLKSYLEPGSKWAQEQSVPQFLVPLCQIIGNWCTGLLYVMSELWGTVVLSLLFWGFANEVCRTSEAKRFYPLFQIGANVSLLFCGGILLLIGYGEKHNPSDKKAKGSFDMMYVLMGLVVTFGLVIMGIYRYMEKYVLTDIRLYDPSTMQPKKRKTKPGMIESLKTVFTSYYVLCIAAMVILYGLTINMVEVYYKEVWKSYFVTRHEKYFFQGSFSLGTGIVALCLLIFVGGKSIRHMGWTFTALVTPAVLVCCGVPFLLMVIAKKYVDDAFGAAVLVALGYLTVVFAKSCKYSFFDPSKEMSYIPLGADRGRAKAAVDVVGARFGKSGSGWLQIAMLAIANSPKVSSIVEAVGVLVCLGVTLWVLSSISLGRQYNEKIALQNQELEATKDIEMAKDSDTTIKA